MSLAGQLEVASQAVTAVLCVWLGLTVVTRSGSSAAWAFARLTMTLAIWTSSIVVQRLTATPGIATAGRAVEEIAAAIAIGATTHFALVIATDGRPTGRQRLTAALVYPVLLAFALPGIVDPARPVAFSEPQFSIGPVPGSLVAWAWVVARLAALGLAAAWLIAARRAPGVGAFRRRQLTAALATVIAGGIGAGLRFLPVVGEADAWIGVSFVTLAVVLATYAVFAAGIFFGQAVADRAFRTSLAGGAAVLLLVATAVVIDRASATLLGLEAPFFTALVLVVAIAVYEPVSSALRRTAAGGARTAARDRLLRALGQPALGSRPAEAGVGPALARLAAALDVSGLTVVGTDGSVIATAGSPVGAGSVRPVPLRVGDQVLGELRVGRAATGALTPHDEELLQLSAAYVSAALLTGRREHEQISQLTQLAEDRADVESRAERLHAALVGHRDHPSGLRVHGLGPLRVERDGLPIERWGGDKAGTRQAEGLFAFLFDRGEHGVAKDEAVELIWPDTDLERADLAFHRTLGGLRSTLDPGRAGSNSRAIRFVKDRYRLEPSMVEWSDVAAFLAAIEAARDEGDPREVVRRLESARRLYRGDYLDDCPYYGDSVHVEQRRTHLRSRYVDLAIVLGERYEQAGDRISAAAAFRDAIDRSQDGCPPAELGLARLGL